MVKRPPTLFNNGDIDTEQSRRNKKRSKEGLEIQSSKSISFLFSVFLFSHHHLLLPLLYNPFMHHFNSQYTSKLFLFFLSLWKQKKRLVVPRWLISQLSFISLFIIMSLSKNNQRILNKKIFFHFLQQYHPKKNKKIHQHARSRRITTTANQYRLQGLKFNYIHLKGPYSYKQLEW